MAVRLCHAYLAEPEALDWVCPGLLRAEHCDTNAMSCGVILNGVKDLVDRARSGRAVAGLQLEPWLGRSLY